MSDGLSFEDIELMAGNRVSAAQLIERVKQQE